MTLCKECMAYGDCSVTVCKECMAYGDCSVALCPSSFTRVYRDVIFLFVYIS